MTVKLELGKKYMVKIGGKRRIVRAVNGEDYGVPGISHGFVHFVDPDTGEKVSFTGVTWFERHAEQV